MNRLSPTFLSTHRRRACALAAAAMIALGAAATAQAGVHAAVAGTSVVFPSPGLMQFSGVPAGARGGHHFTLRGVMPLAIFGGVIHFQRQTPAGGWRTLSSAAVRPKVFWLHWSVPAAWKGQQLDVRFVLDSGGKLLALSPGYVMEVTP
jgi:hypothetical protein